MRHEVATVLVAALAFAGCAGLSIQQGGTGPGYDVFTPMPCLKGTPTIVDAEGQRIVVWNFEIVWLPDYSRPWRVCTTAGFGKADIDLTIENGWKLTRITDKTDNTEVLKEVVDLAKHVIPAGVLGRGLDARKDPASAVDFTEPLLYRIEFDADGQLAGLRRLPIH